MEGAKRTASRSFLCLAFVVLSWRIGQVNSIVQLPSHLSYFSSCLSFLLLNEWYFSSDYFMYQFFDGALCCRCSSFLAATSPGEPAALFSSLSFSLLFLSLLPTMLRQREAQTCLEAGPRDGFQTLLVLMILSAGQQKGHPSTWLGLPLRRL